MTTGDTEEIEEPSEETPTYEEPKNKISGTWIWILISVVFLLGITAVIIFVKKRNSYGG